MDKNSLREQALLHRDRILPDPADAESAAELFRAHVPVREGQIVSAYWPLGKEFDVRFIIDDLIRSGIKVALPISGRESRVMEFALWDGASDLVKGEFGIYVPKDKVLVEPDILIIPFLAFDRKGHRLGRGAGHYDNTLAALRAKKNVLAVGIGYAEQAVLFNLPAEEHDQPLDIIITPKGVHDFRGI